MSSDLSYYPAGYVESRRRFREAAAAFGGELGKWNIPSRTDSDLSVDYLWLAPSGAPKKLFVISSGIHGSESYAGASQQAMFMKEILPRVDRSSAGVLLVHAMNPYGFKYHRRCTEANVNLNRNFSLSGDIFKIRNPESTRLQNLLIPREPVRSLKSTVLDSLAEGISMDEFAKAVGPGQFEEPAHLEFGGFGPEPQTRAMTDFCQKIMGDYEDVVVFDIHTGLGYRNRLHLLREDDPRTLHDDLFRELFDPVADREIYDFTPADTEGFYLVHGAMNSIFGELATPKQRVVALTMEFGTLGHSLDEQIEAFNRWIVDHQGFFYGYATSELEKEAVELNFVRSYPHETDWRLEVMKAARGLFLNTFSRAGVLKTN